MQDKKENSKAPVTIYQMEDVIRRAIDEWTEFKSKSVNLPSDPGSIAASRVTLPQHISKTIIGELFELEVIRKLAPLFRIITQYSKQYKTLKIGWYEFFGFGIDNLNDFEQGTFLKSLESVTNDFQTLENAESTYQQLRNLRIQPEKENSNA